MALKGATVRSDERQYLSMQLNQLLLAFGDGIMLVSGRFRNLRNIYANSSSMPLHSASTA